MERRPEPELMDSEAQTQAYAQADFAESNSLFTECFLAAFPDLPPSGRLIDLGCGPADICIRLARRLPGWRITGLDAGPNMLRRAVEAVEASGLEDRVTLKHCRLPDPELGRHGYDAVVSNSLLHHLTDPMTLWASARQLARPTAPVSVMDLARPESAAAADALVDIYAADAPAILREDFHNSLLAAYTVDEVRQQLAQAGLAGFQVSTPSDRHWLVQGAMPG
jgi:cyclopropane fatty-acyl-phospholipid synthase-like methyltransferase